jgi:hypothetical protein
MKIWIYLIVLFATGASAQTKQAWTLQQSSLTYHMSHPVHELDGTSHAARGKGSCSTGVCEFLIAAPVKSFDSGDSNRDLHMLQVTRGAEFPIIVVKVSMPETELSSATFNCDLEVQFAGHTAHYAHVTFHQEVVGESHRVTGIVPATLTDFQIQPPTFLMVPIKDAIPIRLDLLWGHL